MKKNSKGTGKLNSTPLSIEGGQPNQAMDSTPQQPPIKPYSASKLPIKRKTPHSSHPDLNPNLSPILLPKLEPSGGGDDDGGGDGNPPPFKFHRIWTEPDEIRFLQGLLDSSSLGLSFPRDLNAFYARFSGAMSQPYSKSQLSEKLRRLRKKFRVISSRLARGMDRALLSPHDRALFDLSERLWHPDFSPTSPFGAGDKQKKSNLVGVKVSFSPVLPSASIPVPNQPITPEFNDHGVLNSVSDDHAIDNVRVGGFDGGDVKLSDVNIEFDGGVREQEFSLPTGSAGGGVVGLGQAAAKTVINVFDECLKEVRMALVCQGLPCPDYGSAAQAGSSEKGKVDDFERRWREQRVAELDVLARRLRLVLEHSLQRQ